MTCRVELSTAVWAANRHKPCRVRDVEAVIRSLKTPSF
jgi:hypothetical protein